MENKICGDCRFLESAKIIGFCEKQEHPLCPSELPACSNFEQKVVTNGDRIRQMSNAELAKVLTVHNCRRCIHYNRNSGSCTAPIDKPCADGIEAWLNAPAESEGGR